MNVRFVTRRVHAAIDYPVAASLIAAPLLLGIGASNPYARYLSVAVGVAALVLTILTKHEAGLFRVLPYWFHVAVDRLVGVAFLVAPFALRFSTADSAYYWANAAAVLAATVVLAAPDQASLQDSAVAGA